LRIDAIVYLLSESADYSRWSWTGSVREHRDQSGANEAGNAEEKKAPPLEAVGGDEAAIRRDTLGLSA
jgi:hypothetical protein